MKNLRQLVTLALLSASVPFAGIHSHEYDNSPVLSTSVWGAYLLDAETNEELFSINADKLFIPASVTKLVTSAVALEQLGPSFDFTTEVKASAMPDETGILKGNLSIIGSGDPMLKSSDLHLLAQRVYESGVRVIKGSVLTDDSLFNGTSLPIHGEWEDLTFGYSPEINALSVDYNAVEINISPNPAGNGKAVVTLKEKIPYFQLINNVETVSEAGSLTFNFSRGFLDNIVEISGTIPANYSKTVVRRVAVHNPTEYVRQIFVSELQSLGIIIENRSYTNASSFVIAKVDSFPLHVMVHQLNKNSNNFIGDMLYKYIGLRANAQFPVLGVRNAYSKWFELFHTPQQKYLLYDGSGLSRHNLVTPKTIVQMLQFINGCSFKDEYIASLPIAGVDGTLIKSFPNKPDDMTIQAKTGTMTGISGLAGYATTPSGKKVIFALFINNSAYSWGETTSALEDLLLELLQQ